MSKYLSILLLLLTALTSPSTFAADPKPAVGSYGFDWLAPNTSKCRKIKESDLARFQSCTTDARGFGGYKPTHACKTKDKGEWIIYATRSQCLEEYGTMQSNAP